MMSAITDYLTLFFRQRHINKMPDANWQTFLTYNANNGLRGHMKKWKRDLMHEEDGKLVRNDLPGADQIFKWTRTRDKVTDEQAENGPFAEEDWENLFIKLQNVFARMYVTMSKDKFDDKHAGAATAFINDFYDPDPNAGKIFSLPPIDEKTENKIKEFSEILQDENAHLLMAEAFGNDNKAKEKFNDFKKNILNGKYKKDSKTRDDLIKVLEYVAREVRFLGDDIADQKLKTLVQKSQNLDINSIVEGLSNTPTIDPNKLKQFKTGRFISAARPEGLPYYQAILSRIHDSSLVADEFKRHEYDDDEISSSLEKAKSVTDYTGKTQDAEDDLVVATSNDKKNIIDKFKDKVNDFYDDKLKRYVNLRPEHIYIKPEAQIIMTAIDKLKGDDDKPIKITPKDGIGAIIKNADAIKKAVEEKSGGASKHFDWFVKTLKEIEPDTKKAFANALRNGSQMHRVVETLLIKAVESTPPKLDEAKTAMEILTVMEYGTFTSRTMDAINQTAFTLLSDPNLSWNKNEGVKMVTGALDRMIKLGIQIGGYGVTAVVNKVWRRVGKKFNGHGELLDAKIKGHDDTTSDKFTDFETAMKYENDDDDRVINGQKAILVSLSGEVNEGNIDTKHAEAERLKQELQTKYEVPMQKTQNDLEEYNKLYEQYSKLAALKTTIDNLDSQITELNILPKDKKIQDIDKHIHELESQKSKLDKELEDPNIVDIKELMSKHKESEKLKLELQQLNTHKQSLSTQSTTIENVEQQNEQTVLRQQRSEYETKFSKLLGNYNFDDIKRKYENVFIKIDPKTKKSLFKKALDEYEQKKTLYENESKRVKKQIEPVEKYLAAKEIIDLRETAKKERNKKVAKWQDDRKNNYLELMAFWDFLQTGNTKSMFHLSTKKLQEKMNTKSDVNGEKMSLMEQNYEAWKAANGYAA